MKLLLTMTVAYKKVATGNTIISRLCCCFTKRESESLKYSGDNSFDDRYTQGKMGTSNGGTPNSDTIETRKDPHSAANTPQSSVKFTGRSTGESRGTSTGGTPNSAKNESPKDPEPFVTTPQLIAKLPTDLNRIRLKNLGDRTLGVTNSGASSTQIRSTPPKDLVATTRRTRSTSHQSTSAVASASQQNPEESKVSLEEKEDPLKDPPQLIRTSNIDGLTELGPPITPHDAQVENTKKTGSPPPVPLPTSAWTTQNDGSGGLSNFALDSRNEGQTPPESPNQTPHGSTHSNSLPVTPQRYVSDEHRPHPGSAPAKGSLYYDSPPPVPLSTSAGTTENDGSGGPSDVALKSHNKAQTPSPPPRNRTHPNSAPTKAQITPQNQVTIKRCQTTPRLRPVGRGKRKKG